MRPEDHPPGYLIEFPTQGRPSLETPRGGAGSARPRGRLALDPSFSLLGPQAFVCPPLIMLCPACVRPCNEDAETASLRENGLFQRRPQVFPR
jgi:hypothetical protein